jgi:hypothetical protein
MPENDGLPPVSSTGLEYGRGKGVRKFFPKPAANRPAFFVSHLLIMFNLFQEIPPIEDSDQGELKTKDLKCLPDLHENQIK